MHAYSRERAFTNLQLITAAVLAQSVGRLTAEREVAGSIPGSGPILRVLKNWEMKALQAAGPSRGSDDHVKWGPLSSRRRKNSVPN